MLIIVGVIVIIIIIVMVTPLKKPALRLLRKLSVEGENQNRNKSAKQYVKIGLLIILIPFIFAWYDLLFSNRSNDIMGLGRFISEILATTYSICLAIVILAYYLRNSIVKIVLTSLALLPTVLLIVLLLG